MRTPSFANHLALLIYKSRFDETFLSSNLKNTSTYNTANTFTHKVLFILFIARLYAEIPRLIWHVSLIACFFSLLTDVPHFSLALPRASRLPKLPSMLAIVRHPSKMNLP